MSAPANSTSQPSDASKSTSAQEGQKDNNSAPAGALPQLSALEDDDEFEEFAAEDWQDEPGEGKGSSAVLWEDNWDEADQEDSFSEQLRTALKNPNAGQSGPQPMQS